MMTSIFNVFYCRSHLRARDKGRNKGVPPFVILIFYTKWIWNLLAKLEIIIRNCVKTNMWILWWHYQFRINLILIFNYINVFRNAFHCSVYAIFTIFDAISVGVVIVCLTAIPIVENFRKIPSLQISRSAEESASI